MNPQGNRQNQYHVGNPRMPDPRYAPNFLYQPPTSMGDFRNYGLGMNPYFFGQYPYINMPCPNASFLPVFDPALRDYVYQQPSYMKEMSPLPNFFNPQNIRVTTRETKERSEL